jgi:hypothetical protein
MSNSIFKKYIYFIELSRGLHELLTSSSKKLNLTLISSEKESHY